MQKQHTNHFPCAARQKLLRSKEPKGYLEGTVGAHILLMFIKHGPDRLQRTCQVIAGVDTKRF